MLAARGIIVSHETVRQWALRFGQEFANRIRRRLPRAGGKWHLDEVAIKIAGKKHWLWRAVDQGGMVLDGHRQVAGCGPTVLAARGRCCTEFKPRQQPRSRLPTSQTHAPWRRGTRWR